MGFIAGPSALDVVQFDAQIDLLSELGIAVLLFLVGLKLDMKLIRSLGQVSLLTGLGQVLFTSVFGYLIGLSLGLGDVSSLYIAVALTFSSTIIIVKLLSDKREIDSLHGQIALGFLIVQDLVVVLAMIVLSAIGIGSVTEGGGHGGGSVLLVLTSGVAMVGLVILFVRYIATPLTERLARTPELLVIFAISMAAMFAAIGEFRPWQGSGWSAGRCCPCLDLLTVKPSPPGWLRCAIFSCSFSSLRLDLRWTCRYWARIWQGLWSFRSSF